jgi:hypothetical protein
VTSKVFCIFMKWPLIPKSARPHTGIHFVFCIEWITFFSLVKMLYIYCRCTSVSLVFRFTHKIKNKLITGIKHHGRCGIEVACWLTDGWFESCPLHRTRFFSLTPTNVTTFEIYLVIEYLSYMCYVSWCRMSWVEILSDTDLICGFILKPVFYDNEIILSRTHIQSKIFSFKLCTPLKKIAHRNIYVKN